MLTSMLRIMLTHSFRPFIFKNTFTNSLNFVDIDQLGLYVHIPFCKSICSFCPYCKEIYDKDRADSYKKALLEEIDLACHNLDDKKIVTSLYFGGGTPATMINDLHDIVAKIKRYFSIIGDIGVELHPDDITEENLQKLNIAGVTMVNIGIQSFNYGCLSRLGRKNNSSIEKLEIVKSFGFNAIDVDLIFAIPEQTADNLIDDIKTAFEHGATQVSTYPFIDFSYSNNKYKPMPNKYKRKMLKKLAQYCHDHKIKRTSVWTFNKQGSKRYSSITRDAFLGFGVSAASLLNNRFKINTHSINGYIERLNQGLMPTSLTLDFTRRQKAAYFLFWNSYALNINKHRFAKEFGASLKKMFGIELLIAEKFGYIKEQADNFSLTEKGAALFHEIEQAYTRAYIDRTWNMSRLKPFPDKIVLR